MNLGTGKTSTAATAQEESASLLSLVFKKCASLGTPLPHVKR